MSEWWTYRLDSFLLFSARTYERLIASYNQDLWPWQWVVLALGAAMLGWLGRRHSARRDRIVFVLLGVAWGWVAWAFLVSRFAAINWAADYIAVLFAVQAGALLWAGIRHASVVPRRKPSPTDPIAIVLIVLGLIVYPLIGAMLGRPWSQAALFGLMPEPTAIATLGFVLLAQPMPRWLVVVPLIVCLFSGVLLLALRAGEAWVPPSAALAALACLLWRRTHPPRRR